MSAPRARALAERRAALRRAMEARRVAMRAELARRRAGPGQDPGKKRRWWPILLALLLLLLLRDCRCEEDPVAPPAPAVSGPAAPAGRGQAASVEPPIETKVKRKDRPAFTPEAPEPLPWIGALRLQVAARSPRLAACFVGAARPGALRWSAAVDPAVGRVSEQTLEPTLSGDPLSAEARDCALGVLSDPPYRLEAGQGRDGRSTPARVGLVIEF